MCKEAIPLPASERINDSSISPYVYTIAENMQDIATKLLEASKNQTNHVALVTVMLHFDSHGNTGPNRATDIDQSVRYYLDNLRTLVRKTDCVFLYGISLHFLLRGANLQGAKLVEERLWDALLWRIHSTKDEDILCPCRITIGHSAYPEPHKDVNLCIAAARVARKSFEVMPEKGTHQTTSQPAKDADLPILARRLGIPYLSLLPRKLPLHIRKLVSLQLAQELHCYPLGRERNTLTVAMSNPQDNQALKRLQKETGLHIFPVLAHPQEIQTVLEQLI